MIETIALIIAVPAFLMAVVAWAILRKLCTALSELAAELIPLLESMAKTEDQRTADLLKRARLDVRGGKKQA